MTDRDWAYGTSSKQEEEKVEEDIIYFLSEEYTEEELVTALGDVLTDKMNLYFILQHLEEVGAITSRTTYKNVG